MQQFQPSVARDVKLPVVSMESASSAEAHVAGDTTPSPHEEQILDAALALFGDVGIKKTTIADISQRAGVDRVTVYRRIGSRDDVVERVISREIGKVLAQIAQINESRETLEDRIADSFVMILDAARSHAVFRRLLTLEPGYMIPRLTTDGQATAYAAVTATRQLLERCVADGLLAPASDLDGKAEIIVRITHSFVLTPHIVLDSMTNEDLADIARRYLVPILTGHGTATAE